MSSSIPLFYLLLSSYFFGNESTSSFHSIIFMRLELLRNTNFERKLNAFCNHWSKPLLERLIEKLYKVLVQGLCRQGWLRFRMYICWITTMDLVLNILAQKVYLRWCDGCHKMSYFIIMHYQPIVVHYFYST